MVLPFRKRVRTRWKDEGQLEDVAVTSGLNLAVGLCARQADTEAAGTKASVLEKDGRKGSPSHSGWDWSVPLLTFPKLPGFYTIGPAGHQGHLWEGLELPCELRPPAGPGRGHTRDRAWPDSRITAGAQVEARGRPRSASRV